MQEIMKCLPFEREIRNKGRENISERDMLLFVQSQLGNPGFGFFMAYDDEGNVIGYVIGVLNIIPGFKRVHLLRVYAKKKEIFDGLMLAGSEWARAYKIDIVSITTAKHAKAYKRHYGFKAVSVNMERRIY